MAMVVSIGGLAAAAERPRLTGREAPRATDLLRAETLAEQAHERLRVPKREPAHWRHGGAGWESGGGTPKPADAGSVTIRVSPGRRARR